MRNHLFLSVLLALLINGSGSLHAQAWLRDESRLKSTAPLSFKEKQEAFDRYWSNKEPGKGKGYKPFRRWEYFMESRISTGDTLANNTFWNAVKSPKKSVYDTNTWVFMGPITTPYEIDSSGLTGNGRLNCVAFHPIDSSIIYVGAPSGGFWKSVNSGKNWKTTTDKLNAIGVSDIVVSHENPDVIYIVTGDGDNGDSYSIGILKSIDGGETWNTTGVVQLVSQRTYFRRIIMSPDDADLMLASGNTGIYKTTDGWITYSKIMAGHFRDMEFQPGNFNNIYAASYNPGGYADIYKSTNYGDSFQKVNTGLNFAGDVNRIELAVTPANSNNVYALASSAENDGFYGLFLSEDGGSSWSNQYDNTKINLLGWGINGSDEGGQGWYDLSLAVSPDNVNEVFVGGINIWKSTNKGKDWTLSAYWSENRRYPYVHADHHMFTFSPHSNKLFSANDGGIYYSNDKGTTWTDISNDLQILQSNKIATSQSKYDLVLSGNQDNGTFMFNNGNWFQILGGDGMRCYIDPYNENILYGSLYYGAFFRSDNGGLTFNTITPQGDLEGDWITPFEISPVNSSLVYAGYKDVWRSSDRGDTWQKISDGLSNSNLTQLAVAYTDIEVIYAGTSDTVYKTVDGGKNWNMLTNLPNGYITSISISPNDANKVWLTLSGYTMGEKVYYSTDGGASWLNYSEGLPNIPVNDLVYRKQSGRELYLATDLGVYYRNINMSEWVAFTGNLPNVIVTDVEITDDASKLRVGTYGRGIWEIEMPEKTPMPAEFFSTITYACKNAPFELIFAGNDDYDSISWSHTGATILSETLNRDTVRVLYAANGKYTVGLTYYKGGEIFVERKTNYIEIDEELDLGQVYDEKYLCKAEPISIKLPEAYDYSWTPIDGVVSNGNIMQITPALSTNYVFEGSHGNCSFNLEVPVLLMPDDICNALYLPMGTHGPFSNNCASIQNNEPVPLVGTDKASDGCNAQDGWCNGEARIDNSLWFKVLVPESGKLKISTSGFDTQLALYSAQSCSALLNGNYSIIAANDDYEGNADYAAETSQLSGLNPGDTLYLQVDGSYGGVTGEFNVYIGERPSSLKPDNIDNANENILIYPNPAKNEFTIEMLVPSHSEVRVEVFNLEGKRVCEAYKGVTVGVFKETLNAGEVKGLHIVRITTGQFTVYRKIIFE